MAYKTSIEAISDFLFIEKDIKNVDVAIVFGNDWTETMDELLPYYKNGMVPKIIITGHSANSDKEPEALRFQKRALELGFLKDDIYLEEQATNTKENFEFTKPILENNFNHSNLENILLVCKTFHTRRVLMTAKKFLPQNINYCFLPTIDERKIEKDSWWKDETATKRVLEELGRISQYTLKGDLKL